MHIYFVTWYILFGKLTLAAEFTSIFSCCSCEEWHICKYSVFAYKLFEVSLCLYFRLLQLTLNHLKIKITLINQILATHQVLRKMWQVFFSFFLSIYHLRIRNCLLNSHTIYVHATLCFVQSKRLKKIVQFFYLMYICVSTFPEWQGNVKLDDVLYLYQSLKGNSFIFFSKFLMPCL